MNQNVEKPDKYFPSTSWTLLSEACGATLQASKAREEFARRYHRPVLNYFAALTRDRAEAEELAQSFFEKLAASDGLLSGADRSRGRFRHYLKRALSNFWKSELRFSNRQKRKAQQEVRPDGWSGAGWDRLEIQAQDSPAAPISHAI
ncbi:MAG: RNA polymerase sigma factor [Burkholderiales bacterium]